MHPTLQPWALSLTYIFLLLGGCSGVSPLAYRSYLANNPRWDEYHLGNRILNASFEAIENGKPLAWEGSCKLSSKSAQSGEYSLLLSAESDKKASICRSARIPITPGHYDASVWLKMRDLQLGAERALSNVLQIRLRHYDDRGQLIAEHHADRENKLPPSLMTSAFRGITSNAVAEHEDFLWTHLRADHYPYDYGWIPPETASVALEISFTGPGKVWLDDFSLMYTKWNFPLAERLAKLGKLPKLALFPTPQQVQQVGKERFLSPLDTKICIASKADPRKLHLESHGLNALYEYLTSSDLFVGAARSCPADSFVMLLDLSLASQYSLSLSPHERKVLRKHAEGYVIKPLEGGRGVALLSSQIRGMEYGLLMLRQLFSNNSTGGVDFVPVHIVDYPSIAIRAMTAKDVHHTQYANVFTADHWLPEARLNGFYFELDLHDGKWWEPDPQEIRGIRALRSPRLYDLGVLIHPYAHRKYPELGRELVLADPNVAKEVYSTLQPFLTAGARHVILRTDDLVPTAKGGGPFDYALDQEPDIAQFNNLANAHWDLTTQLAAHLKRNWPDSILYFVPPWYTNFFIDRSGSRGISYLKTLSEKLPQSVKLMWTGQSVRSLTIDEFQARRFIQYVNGRLPVLWDNTVFARRHRDYWRKQPTRYHLNSYFEPFEISLPESLYPAGVYLNVQPNPSLRIQIATAGAYLWNPSAYHPERALWSYLRLRFGEQGAAALLKFDTALWKLKRLEREVEDKHPVLRCINSIGTKEICNYLTQALFNLSTAHRSALRYISAHEGRLLAHLKQRVGNEVVWLTPILWSITDEADE